MWAVVGLGNPGGSYRRTRHNAGFMVVEELAARHGFTLKERNKYNAFKGSIEGETVVLMEPLTFMNLSGDAVREGMRRFGFAPDEIIVVHDDVDLKPGKIKLRLGGGAGGHKGVLSIIDRTGSRDFLRVKVGIGRSDIIPTDRFVLSKFAPDEKPLMEEAFSRAADAVEAILSKGHKKAMSTFNQRL